MKILVGLVCTIAGALAQSAIFRVPSSGYIWDEQSLVLRPIQGFLGSALLGEPVPLPASMRLAVIESSGRFAVAVGDEGLYLINGLDRSRVDSTRVEGAIASIDLIGISPDGTCVALVARKSAQLQIVTGLPDGAVLEEPISFGEFASGINSLAISSRGRYVALLGESPESGAIWLVSRQAGVLPRWLVAADHPSSAVFADDDRDLVYIDEAVVHVIRDLSGAAQDEILVGEGLSRPSALHGAGSLLYIADARRGATDALGALMSFDLTTGQMTSEFLLPVAPDRLAPLGRVGLFALTKLNGEPVYVWSQPDSKVAFIPPPTR